MLDDENGHELAFLVKIAGSETPFAIQVQCIL